MANSLASPTESMVKEVSGLFDEPEEISRGRAVALDYFNKLPIEKSQLYTKYVDILSGLNLDSIELGLPSNSRNIPVEIAHLVKERDEPTLALQVDSQMVRTEIHGALEKEGIVFSDTESALVISQTWPETGSQRRYRLEMTSLQLSTTRFSQPGHSSTFPRD